MPYSKKVQSNSIMFVDPRFEEEAISILMEEALSETKEETKFDVDSYISGDIDYAWSHRPWMESDWVILCQGRNHGWLFPWWVLWYRCIHSWFSTYSPFIHPIFMNTEPKMQPLSQQVYDLLKKDEDLRRYFLGPLPTQTIRRRSSILNDY